MVRTSSMDFGGPELLLADAAQAMRAPSAGAPVVAVEAGPSNHEAANAAAVVIAGCLPEFASFYPMVLFNGLMGVAW